LKFERNSRPFLQNVFFATTFIHQSFSRLNFHGLRKAAVNEDYSFRPFLLINRLFYFTRIWHNSISVHVFSLQLMTLGLGCRSSKKVLKLICNLDFEHAGKSYTNNYKTRITTAARLHACSKSWKTCRDNIFVFFFCFKFVRILRCYYSDKASLRDGDMFKFFFPNKIRTVYNTTVCTGRTICRPIQFAFLVGNVASTNVRTRPRVHSSR